MDHTQVISEQAFRKLVERGEWFRWEGGSRFGWIKLRVSAIYPGYPEASSPSANDATISVPHILESAATLQFLGFTAAASAEIVETFLMNSKHPGFEKDIFAYARAHVCISDYYSHRKDDWTATIDGMGIRLAVRDQILDARFRDLRMTESARFWVLDTMKAKYEFLKALDSRILDPLGTLPVASSTGMPPIDDTEIDLMRGADTTRLMRTMSMNMDRPSRKGINQLYHLQDVSHTGNCESSWATLSGLYVSKQREVAAQYAEYTRVRVREQGHDVIAVGILHITLPKGVLAESVRTFNMRWRRPVARRQDLPTYADSTARCHAIIGPIATINRHKAPESMRLPSGVVATQVCLYGEEIMRKINERCRVWLEFLPSTIEIQEEAESTEWNELEGGVSIGDDSTEEEDMEGGVLIENYSERQEELNDGVLVRNDSESQEEPDGGVLIENVSERQWELDDWFIVSDCLEAALPRASPMPATTSEQARPSRAPYVGSNSIADIPAATFKFQRLSFS